MYATQYEIQAIQVQIALVDDMTTIIEEINKRRIIKTKSKELERLYQAKQQQLERITVVTDNLYMDWKCGDITRAEYLRMKAESASTRASPLGNWATVMVCQ